MLEWSNQDRQRLRQALTSSFRRYSLLKIFVSDYFDQVRLNEIATSQALKVAADDLIEHFEESGDLSDLILALWQARPQNPEVQAFVARLREEVRQRLQLDPPTVDAPENSFELPSAFEEVQLEAFLPKQYSYNVDFGKLYRGLKSASAVCRVSFTNRPTMGTGVLIAPNLVLTNYHVLSHQVTPAEHLATQAQALRLEFGYLSSEAVAASGPEAFGVERVLAWSPPEKLDYALLRVEAAIAQATQAQSLRLPSVIPALAPHGGLNVLQHPQGAVMQVSLSASGVVQADPQRGRVWYVNRTQGGSSGSPCFNDEWQLVALHHAAVSRGFGSVREGILMASILPEILGYLG
ncbi:trypsin-like peptidase domain-containing protein [Leptolyngbya sp. PCC 6406]|uniref:trypsin-like peptidase domain-containing protein n=1 Tax=Leptolyngbya sp. PCC 6406 TaxID=1173264 RepID=UPI0002ACA3B0|nr:trypsin-like peptidase domain-containing protein [Leptolyngbya sp. PCC 6406]